MPIVVHPVNFRATYGRWQGLRYFLLLRKPIRQTIVAVSPTGNNGSGLVVELSIGSTSQVVSGPPFLLPPPLPAPPPRARPPRDISLTTNAFQSEK